LPRAGSEAEEAKSASASKTPGIESHRAAVPQPRRIAASTYTLFAAQSRHFSRILAAIWPTMAHVSVSLNGRHCVDQKQRNVNKKDKGTQWFNAKIP
jgi:hypothetical protein